MLDKFRKIWRNRWVLRSILSSIYFNFHYLPFKQAIKLPILLYKPITIKCRGKIVIDADMIYTGMIRLGRNVVSIYPNTGIKYENLGGTIVFKGDCSIGNNSAIVVGKDATLIFGDYFGASSTFKVICYDCVKFGNRVRFGWDCLVMDTDFHKLTKIKGRGYSKGYGHIVVGNDNWFGCKCIVMKNTSTNDFMTIGSNSLLNKCYDFSSYSVVAGNPLIKYSEGYYRNIFDDIIEYDHSI